MVGRCVGFLGLLAWWLWLMAEVILQSATPILALLREVRETRKPFAKGVAEAVRTWNRRRALQVVAVQSWKNEHT
jgi:Na+-transporting methylmalonyl-CoA/oxaloacetate decarboxylase gamma subunit